MRNYMPEKKLNDRQYHNPMLKKSRTRTSLTRNLFRTPFHLILPADIARIPPISFVVVSAALNLLAGALTDSNCALRAGWALLPQNLLKPLCGIWEALLGL